MNARPLVLAFALLAACSKSTPDQTNTGSIGEVDLASKLPAGVTVPAELKTHDVRRTVCSGAKHDAPIDIRVRWKTFTKDNTLYIASYSVEVVKPAPGVLVQLEKDANVATVKGTNNLAMSASRVSVKCTSRPMGNLFEETHSVFIRADGVSSATPFASPSP